MKHLIESLSNMCKRFGVTARRPSRTCPTKNKRRWRKAIAFYNKLKGDKYGNIETRSSKRSKNEDAKL
jgi:hypothetical protein